MINLNLFDSVGEQLPGCLSLKRVPAHLRFSNGYRTKAASNPNLKAVEVPRQWYNLVADLPVKPPPPLHPKTYEPIKPEDLSHLFPDELIKQEASTERYINIPDEVVDIYGLWRPTPLIRSVVCLSKMYGRIAGLFVNILIILASFHYS